MKVIKDTLSKITKPVNGHNGPEPEMPDMDKLATAIKAAIEAEKDEPNPFPLDSFPKPLAAIVNHWHQVYRRPIDFHGGSIIAAASAALANNVHIEHVAGSVQPVACWCVIVGPPSSAKSPIMRTCMKPLFEREKRYRKKLKDDLAQWAIDKMKAAQDKDKEPKKPELQQRIVNDATIESMIKVLMQPSCWRGVIAFKDEFMGLIKGMNAYKSNGQDLEHFLSMWSGMPIMLNRSGMEYAGFVESPFVAMLGAIQPGILNGLTDGGKVANGFLYRLLFCYPENVQIPLPSKELPKREVIEEYATIIDRLIDLPSDPEGKPTILRMDADAFKAYQQYKTDVEQEIINKTDEENVQSLYGKIVDYTLRLAAIIDLLDLVAQGDKRFWELYSHKDLLDHKIAVSSIHRAIKLSEYFTRNSLKILMKTEDPVAALPNKQRHLYEKLPNAVTSGYAVGVAMKCGMGEKTARRLIRNKLVFAQNRDGSYRKLFT